MFRYTPPSGHICRTPLPRSAALNIYITRILPSLDHQRGLSCGSLVRSRCKGTWGLVTAETKRDGLVTKVTACIDIIAAMQVLHIMHDCKWDRTVLSYATHDNIHVQDSSEQFRGCDGRFGLFVFSF